jgi:hypothetical protein
MIVLGLQQHTGSLLALGAGTWLAFGAKVFFRCPECEGLYDVALAAVAESGDVDFGSVDGPFFFCQTPACGFVRALRLLGWPPRRAFDTSDVKEPTC